METLYYTLGNTRDYYYTFKHFNRKYEKEHHHEKNT